MKLLMFYMEKCRLNKSFMYKSACIVASLFSIMGLFVNKKQGFSNVEAFLMAIALWVVWLGLWILFTKQIIKTSGRIQERRMYEEEQAKLEEKAKKREKAEMRDKLAKENSKKKR